MLGRGFHRSALSRHNGSAPCAAGRPATGGTESAKRPTWRRYAKGEGLLGLKPVGCEIVFNHSCENIVTRRQGPRTSLCPGSGKSTSVAVGSRNFVRSPRKVQSERPICGRNPGWGRGASRKSTEGPGLPLMSLSVARRPGEISCPSPRFSRTPRTAPGPPQDHLAGRRTAALDDLALFGLVPDPHRDDHRPPARSPSEARPFLHPRPAPGRGRHRLNRSGGLGPGSRPARSETPVVGASRAWCDIGRSRSRSPARAPARRPAGSSCPARARTSGRR